MNVNQTFFLNESLLNPSSRFALVCVGSEASSRKLMELLSKRELHGQNPIVTPCNKQSLSQFEMQSRKSKNDLKKLKWSKDGTLLKANGR